MVLLLLLYDVYRAGSANVELLLLGDENGAGSADEKGKTVKDEDVNVVCSSWDGSCCCVGCVCVKSELI